MVKIGIIGGSGIDNPDIFKVDKEETIKTPYGDPSAPLKFGNIDGIEVVLLARHGTKHTISPSGVNYKANIHALKEAGITHIIATTAVGSLRKEIERGDLVILDQFIDFTRHRKITFYDSFEEGNAKHTPMADPFNENLRKSLIVAGKELSLKIHEKGTVVTIEGPRFSTRAESNMFRLWGADVINMSIAPECILANEIGIPYVAVAMSTDYDCWKTDEEPVTWDEIVEVFSSNVRKVTDLITKTIPKIE
jgi:5'-methylthioadenosine phosphorylase